MSSNASVNKYTYHDPEKQEINSWDCWTPLIYRSGTAQATALENAASLEKSGQEQLMQRVWKQGCSLPSWAARAQPGAVLQPQGLCTSRTCCGVLEQHMALRVLFSVAESCLNFHGSALLLWCNFAVKSMQNPEGFHLFAKWPRLQAHSGLPSKHKSARRQTLLLHFRFYFSHCSLILSKQKL